MKSRVLYSLFCLCLVVVVLGCGNTEPTTPTGPPLNPNAMMGGPPTGNSVNIKEFIFFRLAGGKIVEMWDSWDDKTFAHQLGGQPPVPAASA